MAQRDADWEQSADTGAQAWRMGTADGDPFPEGKAGGVRQSPDDTYLVVWCMGHRNSLQGLMRRQ